MLLYNIKDFNLYNFNGIGKIHVIMVFYFRKPELESSALNLAPQLNTGVSSETFRGQSIPVIGKSKHFIVLKAVYLPEGRL